MQKSPPVPRPTVGRTFLAAIVLLGVVAFLQVVAITSAFVSRVRADAAARKIGPAPELPEPPGIIPPDTMFELPEEQPLPTPPTALPRPTPVPQAAERARLTPEARVSALIQQAKALRESGDLSSALVKLREAQTVIEDSPLVLAEMALTYEQLGAGSKAAEHWRRLEALGESAGALRELAMLKLLPSRGIPDPTVPASEVPVPRSGKDAEGLQPGSVLGLIDVRSEEEEDPEAEKHLRLRIGIKARQGSSIDERDVVIQVFFYDLVGEQHIVQTNASVNYQWITSPADWKDDGIEVLGVEYMQPKRPPAEASSEQRKYLGYIVRVYYKNGLEDVRADPVKLLTHYPPPLEIEAP